MELYRYSASQLSEMMGRGECSSLEVTQSVLGRIAEIDKTIGAYITVCADKAIEQAKMVDKLRSIGERLSPLAGIPIAVKDSICTKGLKTTCGSKMLENFVPPYNATVMDRLESAHAVILGKTNMGEFSSGMNSNSSHFGNIKNSLDLDRTVGGSSGGSAAAVAAGESIAALGTDTGGSVRLPAAFCGLVGFKPTFCTVSRHGVIAMASSLEQVGTITHTVKDSAMLYDILRGVDSLDACTTAHPHKGNLASSIIKGVKGKVIGIPAEYFGEDVEPEIAAAVMVAAKLLEKEGAVLKEVSLPSTRYALGAYYVISCAEASSNFAAFDGVRYGFRAHDCSDYNEMFEKTRSQGFGDETKTRIAFGTFVLGTGKYEIYFKRAKLAQQKIKAEFDEVFKACDCLITPTTSRVAGKILTAVDYVKKYNNNAALTPVNLAGLPGISVPCGKGRDNMPAGMQLIGAAFSEETLFSIANHFEELTREAR